MTQHGKNPGKKQDMKWMNSTQNWATPSTWNTIPQDTIPQKHGTMKSPEKKKQLQKTTHKMNKGRNQKHRKRKLAQYKVENFAALKKGIHKYMTFVS